MEQAKAPDEERTVQEEAIEVAKFRAQLHEAKNSPHKKVMEEEDMIDMRIVDEFRRQLYEARNKKEKISKEVTNAVLKSDEKMKSQTEKEIRDTEQDIEDIDNSHSGVVTKNILDSTQDAKSIESMSEAAESNQKNTEIETQKILKGKHYTY